MLRLLLYLCASMPALVCYCQTDFPAKPSPSEVVVEDPGKTVTHLTSTVAKHSRITLTWLLNGELPNYFAIERSHNGKSFETVTVLSNLDKRPQYQWSDDAPRKGRSFYRLRYAFGSGPELYSPTITVALDGYSDFRFYPNPVDQILIIRSEMPVDVQITDATGKVRIAESRVKGIHTVNVSSLEKGIYLIRFSNKLINVMSQEKLIKN